LVLVRAGHAFAQEATLDRYVGMRHLVVSLGGDPHGFVDTATAASEIDTGERHATLHERYFRRFTIGGDMKHDDSLASQRVAYTKSDLADAGNVHIANKSPMFDIGDFIDDGKVHIANKSPAFDVADFVDDGKVHIANKSPAFDIALMDEAA